MHGSRFFHLDSSYSSQDTLGIVLGVYFFQRCMTINHGEEVSIWQCLYVQPLFKSFSHDAFELHQGYQLSKSNDLVRLLVLNLE